MERRVPKRKIGRRKFISLAWLLPVTISASASALFYNFASPGLVDDIDKLSTSFKDSQGKQGTKGKGHRRIRKHPDWHYEGLIANTKTSVIHYPSKSLFRYNNEIKKNRQQFISMENWELALKNNCRLNRARSGVILEVLTLRTLQTGITDSSLMAAAQILKFAFQDPYRTFNQENWRLYDLALQLVCLNTTIEPKMRRKVFIALVGTQDKAGKVPKGKRWITDEAAFETVAQLVGKEAEKYRKRLLSRIFTGDGPGEGFG